MLTIINKFFYYRASRAQKTRIRKESELYIARAPDPITIYNMIKKITMLKIIIMPGLQAYWWWLYVHNPLHTNFNNTGLVLLFFKWWGKKEHNHLREREKETLCRKTTTFLSVQTISIIKYAVHNGSLLLCYFSENNILSLAD